VAAILSKEMLPEPSAEQQAVIGAMHDYKKWFDNKLNSCTA